MKILADIDIPFVNDYFADGGELILKPGRLIEHGDVKDVDILLVRSVTPVNEALLRNTAVKFVGSVASGVDHVDTAWLAQAGIQWCAASGYNAIAVSDYVMSVLAALYHEQSVLPPLRVGVVGVGHVGSHVAARFKSLGFEVYLSDPPRAEQEKDFNSTAFSVFPSLDLVTIHTPLTRSGKYPTYHLIDAAFLRATSKKNRLINASRGAVVDAKALSNTLGHLHYCFDVWEQEPDIDLSILQSALIATPHLAGHSVQSRHRGIDMIYHAACEAQMITPATRPLPAFSRQDLSFDDRSMTWQAVVLAIFNPLDVTVAMKEVLLKEPRKCATLFDQLRQHYIGSNITRHEFGFTTISRVRLAEKDRYILTQLGIHIKE